MPLEKNKLEKTSQKTSIDRTGLTNPTCLQPGVIISNADNADDVVLTLIFKGLGRESTTITRSYLHDLKSLNPIPKEITKFLPNRNDPFACGNLNFLIKISQRP